MGYRRSFQAVFLIDCDFDLETNPIQAIAMLLQSRNNEFWRRNDSLIGRMLAAYVGIQWSIATESPWSLSMFGSCAVYLPPTMAITTSFNGEETSIEMKNAF